jgi:quinone-modifying oxidoreductase subunit QmoB
MDKLGTFICTGCDIDKAVDTAALTSIAAKLTPTLCVSHACLCSKEGRAVIDLEVNDKNLNGVLIAACSPRVKVDAFTFDRTKTASVRVALREQVAWTMDAKSDDTQTAAEDLIRMGAARLSKESLPKPLSEKISKTVLVVGGGLCGLTSVKAAADLGYDVVLVEKSATLGGYLRDLKTVPPMSAPYTKPHDNPVHGLQVIVEGHPKIRAIKGRTVNSISGQPGQFKIQVGEESFEAGAIIQATGAQPKDTLDLAHLGIGVSKNVITSQALERMIAENAIKRPSDNAVPKTILFVQCAGSRDKERLAYCSAECCQNTLRQIHHLRETSKDITCMVVYKDVRAMGLMERFYASTQELGDVLFTKGDVDKVEEQGNGLRVSVKDSLFGGDVSLEADLVVLAVGMVPVSADGEAIRELTDARARIEKNESEIQVAEAKKKEEALLSHQGTEILHLNYRQGPDLPQLKYGFPDSHFICFPYETRRTGIYTGGAVRAPMDPASAISDGFGAAMKAVQSIEAAARGEALHPRSQDISICDFFLQRCTQCKRCTEECPFGTLNEDVKGTPEYNPLRCRRCGICLGACPERIVSFPEFSIDTTASMIKSFEIPDEFEEKPRILVFMCENDAAPALDAAAQHRLRLSPWVRIIEVRCLGACNNVWVADALSRGIDGVLFIGCKRGDDYQCHNIHGSKLAHTRISNIGETLSRLALESERVKVVELERNEMDRVISVIEEFVAEMEEIGPSPLKGF